MWYDRNRERNSQIKERMLPRGIGIAITDKGLATRGPDEIDTLAAWLDMNNQAKAEVNIRESVARVSNSK